MYDQVEIYRLITKPFNLNAPKAQDVQRAQPGVQTDMSDPVIQLDGELGRHIDDIAGDVRLSLGNFALA